MRDDLVVDRGRRIEVQLMKTQQGRRRTAKSASAKANKRLVRTLLAACDKPSDALELRYWSKEPGLIEIVRGIVMMPEEVRAAIEAFILLARDMNAVTASLDRRGLLTLASRNAARSVALAQYVATNDGADPPRLLN
jgi:hypothetical protein